MSDIKEGSDTNVGSIENLKILLFQDNLTQYGKRKLIEYYEKKIKELEEENQRLKAKIDVVNWQEKTAYQCLKENYIPKQKIKDKIEEDSNIIKEIEEKIKEEENSEDVCREYIRDLNRQKGLAKRDVLTLQELLPQEETNE